MVMSAIRRWRSGLIGALGLKWCIGGSSGERLPDAPPSAAALRSYAPDYLSSYSRRKCPSRAANSFSGQDELQISQAGSRPRPQSASRFRSDLQGDAPLPRRCDRECRSGFRPGRRTSGRPGLPISARWRRLPGGRPARRRRAILCAGGPPGPVRALRLWSGRLHGLHPAASGARDQKAALGQSGCAA